MAPLKVKKCPLLFYFATVNKTKREIELFYQNLFKKIFQNRGKHTNETVLGNTILLCMRFRRRALVWKRLFESCFCCIYYSFVHLTDYLHDENLSFSLAGSLTESGI